MKDRQPEGILPMASLSPLRRLAVAVTIALVGIASLASASIAAATPYTTFAATSPWNKPASGSATLSPLSGAYRTELVRQVAQYGSWINSYAYSSPVYEVGASQALVKVTLDRYNRDLAAAFAAVPLPNNARPASGSDGHLVLLQPSTNRMWEFYKLRRLADGWHAAWGGWTTSLSTFPGYYPGNFGSTGSGLSILGGLIRLRELDAGRIDHAVALAIPQARSTTFVWPAQRTDGKLNSPTAIPEGTVFRLDPSLNVASLGLPRAARIIAEAAQRYGMVVRDQAGSVVFEMEDPTPAGIAVNTAYFDGMSAGQVLKRFPWDRVQAIQPGA
jgi:hypothetical protein